MAFLDDLDRQIGQEFNSTLEELRRFIRENFTMDEVFGAV